METSRWDTNQLQCHRSSKRHFRLVGPWGVACGYVQASQTCAQRHKHCETTAPGYFGKHCFHCMACRIWRKWVLVPRLHTRHRTPNHATKNPTSLTRASGAPTRRTQSSRVVVTVVPNPRRGKLLALLDVTRGKLVNPATKKPAPEYPTAGTGIVSTILIDCQKQSGLGFN